MFSEDPFLTATMGTADIEGLQSQHVMADVKHLVTYNQETNRNAPADNVVLNARALHEIYLPPFYSAVERAKAASVMCSYALAAGGVLLPGRGPPHRDPGRSLGLFRVDPLRRGRQPLDRRVGDGGPRPGARQRRLDNGLPWSSRPSPPARSSPSDDQRAVTARILTEMFDVRSIQQPAPRAAVRARSTPPPTTSSPAPSPSEEPCCSRTPEQIPAVRTPPRRSRSP